MHCVLLGEVDWPICPKVGDVVVVYSGWGGERVTQVWHNFHSGTVTVYLTPDVKGEYAKKVEADGLLGSEIRH